MNNVYSIRKILFLIYGSLICREIVPRFLKNNAEKYFHFFGEALKTMRNSPCSCDELEEKAPISLDTNTDESFLDKRRSLY